MQSVTGTNLVPNAGASSRKTIGNVYFKWDGTNWTDETSRLFTLNGSIALSSPRFGRAVSGAALAQSATIELHNASGRFSPENASGALYSYISANKGIGIDVKIKIGFNDPTNGDDVLTQFIGKTDAPSIESPVSKTVTFSCIGEEYKTFEHKEQVTSAIKGVKENKFLADWIALLATEAGITSTDIDTSIFRIPYVWLAAGDDIWREMQLCAAAEGGYLYFSQDGELRFENAYHWLTDSDHATSVETLDESDYKNVTLNYEQREVYNVVEASYKPRNPGARSQLFKLSEMWQINPGDTRTFTAKLRQPAIHIETLEVNVDYAIVDDGGIDRSSDVSITYTKRAQEIDIAVTNSNTTYQVTFAKFALFGIPLVGGVVSQVIVNSTGSAIGDPTSGGLVKTYKLPTNDYVQTYDQAYFLASMIADRYKDPRLTIAVSGVPGRPYLEVGDRITIDASAEGFNDDVFIIAISWRYDENHLYEQTLTCLEADSFFPYAKSDYFILGDNVPSDTKRIFY